MKRLVLILLIAQLTTAQSVKKTMNLQELCTYIENTYDVRFSYKTDLITKSTIQNIDPNASLETLLNEIKKQTSLFADKIDDRYYIILNKKESGKITLCGTLVNPFLDIPIENATITNLETQLSTTSDINGYFELYLSNNQDRISISALGYNIKYVSTSEISGKPCPLVSLEQLSSQLDEVLISDYLKNDLDKVGKDGNFSLNPNKVGLIAGLAEPDIFETLQILPGVHSVSDSASELLIRGGNPDQNLILLDGIRLYNLSHLSGAFSIVNPYITENVKLYRGDGVNPKYGGALGGIIDISSISKIPKRITGSLGSTLVSSDLNISVPLGKKFAVIASARTSLSTFFENDTSTNYLDRATQNIQLEALNPIFDIVSTASPVNNSFDFHDFTLKIIAKLNQKNDLSLTNFYNSNRSNTNIEQYEGSEGTRDWDNSKTSLGIGGTWKHRFSDKLYSSLSGSFSGFNETIIKTDQFILENPATKFDIAKYEIEDISSDAYIVWQPDQYLKVNAGYQFSDISIFTENENLSSDFLGQRSNQTHVLYSNIQFKLKSILSSDLGFRASRYSILLNSKYYMEPRMSFRIKIFDNFKTRLSYAVNTQTIHQLSYLIDGSYPIETNPWVMLQPLTYKDPLRNQQGSLSFIFFTNNWNINLDLYTKETTNINTGIRAFQQISTPDLGTSSTSGLDVLIKKRIDNYQSIMTYSFMEQLFNFEGLNQNEPFAGNFDATHIFSWSHLLQIKKLSLSLRWNYRTGTPYTTFVKDGSHIDQNLNVILEDDDAVNNTRFKPYHRLDASSTYEFHISKKRNLKGKLVLSLYNLYNRINEIGVYYDNNTRRPDGVDQQIFTRKSLGITSNLAFRIMF